MSIPERFLALGDSFTIGTGTTPERSFPAVLADIWRERGRVIALTNPAVNGYATDDLIQEELPLLAAIRPTLVTLLIGANDLVRGSTEDRYRSQLVRIHERIRADAPDARVGEQLDRLSRRLLGQVHKADGSATPSGNLTEIARDSYGIELVDIRLRRFNYPAGVATDSTELAGGVTSGTLTC